MDDTKLEKLRAALKNNGLEQMLIVDPLSIYYLSGIYNEPFERFYGLYVSLDKFVVILNRLFFVPADNADDKLWYEDSDDFGAYMKGFADPSKALGVDKDLRAGFLLRLIDGGFAESFVNASHIIDELRAVKDEGEQAMMREASRINDMAMGKFKALVHEGVTEKEIADQMLAIYKSCGADGYSFEPLVAFGANAADPHHSPDNTVIKEGDNVMLDVGCKKDSYCSDMTRTFFYKTVSDEARRIYELVKQANEAAEAQIAPGKEIHILDDTARGIITKAGYGAEFNHRLGHFIGLNEHEAGDVSASNSTVLKPGMIFSIEPGIYIKNKLGVRIEDLVLVTENGFEKLNNYSKELEIIE